MKVLIICRDNIGDSILATPLINAVSKISAEGIHILTNGYASPVFKGNPQISTTWEYNKSKHCATFTGKVKAGFMRLSVVMKMRAEKFDAIIIAKSEWDTHSLKWVKYVKAKKVIAYGEKGHKLITNLLNPCPPGKHVAEVLHNLSQGLTSDVEHPSKSIVYADEHLVNRVRKTYKISKNDYCIALQISSRKPCQQWSASNFIALARLINIELQAKMILLWSPGDSTNLMHPGDDLKAEYISSHCHSTGIKSIKTENLEELKAALSVCNLMVSSDGGAVHIAAALNVSVVAMYGNSDPKHWSPWQVPHRIILGENHNVHNITPLSVLKMIASLKSSS